MFSAVSVRGVFGAVIFFAAAAPAQDTSLEFEAASLKLAIPPSDGRYAIGFHFDPGRLTADYVTMRDLLQTAYAVPAGHKLIGPDWIDSDSVRYNLNAKAAGAATNKELCIMLRNLLSKRCQVKVHTEDRVTPVFALVVGSKGFKLTPVEFAGDKPNFQAVHYRKDGAEFKHTSMALLANILTIAGRPVIDSTGIKGVYDFQLTFFNPLFHRPTDPEDEPTIPVAVQQIGLKMESREAPVAFYIVDHVERTPVE